MLQPARVSGRRHCPVPRRRRRVNGREVAVASVFFRGPKAAPRWYARIKARDGRWVSRRVRQETRADARKAAAALEAREDAGLRKEIHRQ